MELSHSKNAKVFKALCDEKRLGIMEILQSGEKCICVLLELLQLPQSTLSYHMRILCESGIVEGRQDGKWTHYHISERGSKAAAELLKKLTTKHTEQTKQEQSCCIAP